MCDDNLFDSRKHAPIASVPDTGNVIMEVAFLQAPRKREELSGEVFPGSLPHYGR